NPIECLHRYCLSPPGHVQEPSGDIIQHDDFHAA
ncbi:unnamed protein product, partial [Rotaria sp. Silwood2]